MANERAINVSQATQIATSIKGQLTELNGRLTAQKSALDNLDTIVDHYNLVNPFTLTDGYITSTGAIQDNTKYKTTDYIPVSAGESIVCSPRLRFFLAFDNSKSPISASYVNANQENYVFTAQVDGYIRATLYNNTIGVSAQIERGTIPSSYKPFNIVGLSDNVSFGSKQTTEINDLIDAKLPEEEWYERLVSANLFNYENGITGLLQSNLSPDTNSNYKTSDYIPVEAGQQYIIKKGVGATGRLICGLYLTDKTPISGTYQNLSNVETTTVTPSSNGFLRFSTNKGEHFNQAMVVKSNIVPDEYVRYYNILIPSDTIENGNILWKKKWAVCGDSFTFGADTGTMESGIYVGKNIVYPYIIGDRNNMEILQFFQSGKTLAFPANPGNFKNALTCPTHSMYYQNIPDDVDYITIYLGINDEHHYTGGGDGEDSTGLITLGTIDDNTTDTYYGAWNVVLSWLITNRPFAHIGIIITNGLSISDWYNAQINIAKKYGIPYLNLNGDKDTPAMLRSMNPEISSVVKSAITEKQRVSSSNLHPNNAAHKFEADFIENFLRKI